MDWKGIPITDGTGQQDRESAALAADYFNVDEHSFENLLAMGAEFASVLKYYNLNNKEQGNWSDMFNADEAVIMATIVGTDLQRVASDFRRIPFSRSEEQLDFLVDLAAKINFWYLRLCACRQKSAELLARKMATLIGDKLAPELGGLYRIARRAELTLAGREISEFAAVWDLGSSIDNLPPGSADEAASPGNFEIKNQLNASFNIFSNAISYLKSNATACLQQSLGSKQHDPSIGLFIVFVKLYQKVQRRLNRFTLRHLEFYYRKILEIDNKPQILKSFYLLLEAQAGSDRVRVKKGTEFSAGNDAELNDIIYTADEELVVTDARVEALATLYLQHDGLISPESDLGFVTRIKSDKPLSPDSGSGMNQDHTPGWGLFGVEKPGGVRLSSNNARIGFSIASPVLLLEQGARVVDVAFDLEPVSKTWIEQQVSKLQTCKSQQTFSRLFGGLFARCLLSFDNCLQSEQKLRIIARAASLLSANLASEVFLLLYQDQQWLFYKLFKKSFSIRLTTENGWLEVQDYYLQLARGGVLAQQSSFKITFNLGQDIAPIIPYDAALHGEELQTELPVLQCLINPQSDFCVYSLFQDLVIESIRIDVDVTGVKNLLVYNHHGQLDAAKPFQPFGPMPGSSAYFVFGSYELARKPLKELKINLDWADLPRVAGGFAQHYQGYETAYDNCAFKAEFSVLADSQWESGTPESACELFETSVEDSRVASRKLIEIDKLDGFKPIESGVDKEEYGYDLMTRSGFFQLSLAAPDSAFGHGEYGQLLTKVLSANAKKKKPAAVPNAPYTPTLKGISLDYKASATIKFLATDNADSRLPETVFHMHPFGVEVVFPSPPDAPRYLIPQYAHEGNLFIGLSGKSMVGPLSLLFDLSQDLAQATITEREALKWFYLSANRWKELPAEQVLFDTTHGFLSTGKIRLNIPADISNDNSVMPGDYYWLRVSVGKDAGAFPGCRSIKPHALKISRKNEDSLLPPARDPANETKWSAVSALPEIGSIKQACNAFGGRAGESDSHLRVRLSERLRHKNRALIPRDYEQLVLEEFPEIVKAKCFNSVSSTEDTIKPGQVLIVVVPDTRHRGGESCAQEMINAQKLKQIRTYIEGLCPKFATIEVRNPLYERVQVRCRVKFVEAGSEGNNILRLNREISDYICPWKVSGYRVRFGWSIRQQDIESHILGLDYVDAVTDFSMLHITIDNEGKYSLFDTVRDRKQKEKKWQQVQQEQRRQGKQHGEIQGDQQEDRQVVIRPRYPWSLALPVEKHFIQTMETKDPIEAEETGVDELAVGGTFIIVGSGENGEKE